MSILTLTLILLVPQDANLEVVRGWVKTANQVLINSKIPITLKPKYRIIDDFGSGDLLTDILVMPKPNELTCKVVMKTEGRNGVGVRNDLRSVVWIGAPQTTLIHELAHNWDCDHANMGVMRSGAADRIPVIDVENAEVIRSRFSLEKSQLADNGVHIKRARMNRRSVTRLVLNKEVDALLINGGLVRIYKKRKTSRRARYVVVPLVKQKKLLTVSTVLEGVLSQTVIGGSAHQKRLGTK